MAIDLLNLQPTKVSKDLRDKYILLYGAPKSGKTSFAASIPQNLLLCFEHGINGLDGVYAVDITKWSEFTQVLKQLEKPEVKAMYNTVTLDTIDLAWACAEKYVLAQNMTSSGEIPKSLGEIPWGGGFTQCKKLFDEALRKIAQLGYGVVLISHEKQTTKKDEKTGEEYQYITCTLPDMAKLIANRFVDAILYLKMDREGNRVLCTRDGKNIEAGSRFQYLDPIIPLGYDELTNALAKAIDEEAINKGKKGASVEANPNAFLAEARPFEETINEAKTLFTTLMEQDANNGAKMNDAIVKVFGKSIKLSETTPAQQDLVETVIVEWKNL